MMANGIIKVSLFSKLKVFHKQEWYFFVADLLNGLFVYSSLYSVAKK